jgi:light-harvesting protein B-800-850 alpha chain
MNQGRIWCVVNPTVGLPLFIGSVAVTSLIVHYSILSHTTWFSAYWNGGAKGKAADEGTVAPVAGMFKAQPGYVISVSPVAAIPGKSESSFVITVAPDPAAKVEAAANEVAPPPPDTLAMTTAGPN